MGFGIRYEIEGLAAVQHRMLGIGERAIAPEPVLEAIADGLRKIESDLFDQQGHGTWPPLAASTVEKKGHSTILVDSEALKRSLTEKGASGSVSEVHGPELIFGTRVVSDDGAYYPGFLRSGTRNMPARDPLQFDVADLRAVTKSIQAYLVGLDVADGFNLGGDWADRMPAGLA